MAFSMLLVFLLIFLLQEYFGHANICVVAMEFLSGARKRSPMRHRALVEVATKT